MDDYPSKIVAIHQPNYIPWLGYFYNIFQSDVFVFLDDAPWYAGKLNLQKINTLHSDLVWPKLLTMTEIKHLSTCITEKVIDINPDREGEAEEDLQSWSKNLQSQQFQTGLLRLLKHQGVIEIPDLQWLSKISVKGANYIRTELWLNSNGNREIAGRGETNNYYDPEDNDIYLNIRGPRLMVKFLASTITAQLGVDSQIVNLSDIEIMIDEDPSNISDLLNDLKISKIEEADKPEWVDEDPSPIESIPNSYDGDGYPQGGKDIPDEFDKREKGLIDGFINQPKTEDRNVDIPPSIPPKGEEDTPPHTHKEGDKPYTPPQSKYPPLAPDVFPGWTEAPSDLPNTVKSPSYARGGGGYGHPKDIDEEIGRRGEEWVFRMEQNRLREEYSLDPDELVQNGKLE